MKKNICSLLAGCVVSLAAIPAYALDGASLVVGNGDGTDMARVGLQWNWQKTWFDTGAWRLGGFWDLSLGSWDGHSSAGETRNIVDVGVTPVFQLQRKAVAGFAPYVEGAIGFHLLSHTAIDARRKFGTSFQFGDHVGVGVRFGAKQEYDLAYLYQHLSNGGIKHPNNGINFNQVRFAYHF